MLEHHGVASLFTEILGCLPDEKDFKKANMIRQTLKGENAIMIGDKPQDIQAGKECNIRTCGVLYGYGTVEEINAAAPDFFASSVEALYPILFS